MERNFVERIKNNESEPNNVHITLFRHGTAKYEQGKVSISEAQDLTEEGRVLVKFQAEKLADELDQEEEITIWSSPMGRTIETALIIADVFREKGFNIRLKDQSVANEVTSTAEAAIRVFEVLEEVRGLNIGLFSALVGGGRYTFEDGNEVVFDKNITNPNNLSFQDYYYQEEYKIYLQKNEDVPDEVQVSLNALEEQTRVHNRFDRNINRALCILTDKGILQFGLPLDKFDGIFIQKDILQIEMVSQILKNSKNIIEI